MKFWKFHLYRTPFGFGSTVYPRLDGKYQPTWEEWEYKIKKLCPLQYFFREEILGWIRSKRSNIREIIWNVKCIFFPRNIIRAEKISPSSGYAGDIIHYGLLQVVEDFLKSECSDYYKSNKLEDRSLEFWRDINEAYVYLQPKASFEREIAMEDYINWCFRNGHGFPKEEVERMNEETDKMLAKIIKWRGWL